MNKYIEAILSYPTVLKELDKILKGKPTDIVIRADKITVPGGWEFRIRIEKK